MSEPTVRPSVPPNGINKLDRIIGQNGSRLDKLGTVAVLLGALYYVTGEHKDLTVGLQGDIKSMTTAVDGLREAVKEFQRSVVYAPALPTR